MYVAAIRGTAARAISNSGPKTWLKPHHGVGCVIEYAIGALHPAFPARTAARVADGQSVRTFAARYQAADQVGTRRTKGIIRTAPARTVVVSPLWSGASPRGEPPG